MYRTREHKKPTRRKPNRPSQPFNYITVDDYMPTWRTWAAGALIALGILGVITLLGFGRTQGWW